MRQVASSLARHFVSCSGMVVIYGHWISPHLAAREPRHDPLPRAVIVRQEISQREFALSGHPALRSTAPKKKRGIVWPGFTMALDFAVSPRELFRYAQENAVC
jgi:hypothetical protein